MTTLSIRQLADLEHDEPALEFLLCKTMDYGRRIRITMGLAGFGVLMQVAFFHVLAGLPFLLGALLMSWVIGFDNKVTGGSFRTGATWEAAPFERLTEMLALEKQIKKWDQSAFDITSISGFGLALASALIAAVVTVVLWQWSIDLALIFAIDVSLLVLLQWFSGMRTVDQQPTLIMRAKHLVASARDLDGSDSAPCKLGAQLLMGGASKDSDGHPTNAKVTVAWPDGPDHFFGVQGQVVLNTVQGHNHPYFYAVLVARDGHGLIDATEHVDLPAKVIRETQRKDDVEVVIIRQLTTKTGGYSTDPSTCRKILNVAVGMGTRYVDSESERE